MGGPQGPPPPPVMDEGSQASNASASSSLPEDRVETPKSNNKPTMSHPPTPNTLPSPGAASMSSFHDEFESVSSPSWPRTPASPVIVISSITLLGMFNLMSTSVKYVTYIIMYSSNIFKIESFM